MVSCQKGPTRHAYTWQIGPFWRDTLDVSGDDKLNLQYYSLSLILQIFW